MTAQWENEKKVILEVKELKQRIEDINLEIEDAEEIIYNQDIDDMSDVLVKLLKEAKAESDTAKRSKE